MARAALDWAIVNGLEHGGWCPAGRKAEDGTVPARYALSEIDRNRSGPDIRANILGCDAMLVLNLGALDGWTHRTVAICQRARKAHFVVALDRVDEGVVADVRAWLANGQIGVLYVTGPRESKRPGIATATARFLDRLFGLA